jgi:hypothetical protein
MLTGGTRFVYLLQGQIEDVTPPDKRHALVG